MVLTLFVAAVALAALVVSPWVAVAFVRWFVGRLNTGKGAALAFGGWVTPAVFAAFAAYVAAAVAIGLVHSRALILVFDFTVGPVCQWLFLCWIANNTTVDGVPLRMDYGKALPFTLRDVVAILSIFTVVGWIWAGPWLMRWVTEQVNSGYGKFSYALTPGEFLKYVAVTFVYSLGVVTIPWAMVYFYRRLINRVEVARPSAT